MARSFLARTESGKLLILSSPFPQKIGSAAYQI
ncbi:hypothetical protein CsSME_00028976 [Camellia sinensis var. sinensis]